MNKTFLLCVLGLIIAACGGIKLQNGPAAPAPSQSGFDGPNTALFANATGSIKSLAILASNTLNKKLYNDPTIVSSFIRAQGLSRGNPQFLAVKPITVSTICPLSGNMKFCHSNNDIACKPLDVVASTEQLDISGTYDQSLTNCALTNSFESSDGDCDFESTLSGDFEVEYSFFNEPNLATYKLESRWATTEPIDYIFKETSHDLEFDVTLTATEDPKTQTLTGTVTIDDVTYDVSEKLDTSNFSSEQLGCAE